jgi:hypothetical protein
MAHRFTTTLSDDAILRTTCSVCGDTWGRDAERGCPFALPPVSIALAEGEGWCICISDKLLVGSLPVWFVGLGLRTNYVLDLAIFARLCSRKPLTKTVHYDTFRWFEHLDEKRVTAVTLTGVPAEDGSGNTVSVEFLVLPGGNKWPCFLQDKHAAAVATSIILLKGGVEYPPLPEVSAHTGGAYHQGGRRRRRG